MLRMNKRPKKRTGNSSNGTIMLVGGIVDVLLYYGCTHTRQSKRKCPTMCSRTLRTLRGGLRQEMYSPPPNF